MKNILASIALLLFSAPICAELEIIQLKHRSADELLPVIRPLLGHDGSASGMNYQLILRTSPDNLEQIRELLNSIDVAPRRLQITVMQNVDSETVARLTEVSANMRLNHEARISLPDSGNSGMSVEVGKGQDRLRARMNSTSSLEDQRNTQQLQVLEGHRALVRSGLSVPVPQRQVVQNSWGVHVIENTQYQDVTSGFYVLPRINGEHVTLEITTENNALAPGVGNYPATHIQQTSSAISGRLGEWLEVSGLNQQKNSNDSTLSTHSSSRTREQRSVLIRVEELR